MIFPFLPFMVHDFFPELNRQEIGKRRLQTLAFGLAVVIPAHQNLNQKAIPLFLRPTPIFVFILQFALTIIHRSRSVVEGLGAFIT